MSLWLGLSQREESKARWRRVGAVRSVFSRGGKPLGVLRKGMPWPGLHTDSLPWVLHRDADGAGSQESIRDSVVASWGWGRWWQLRLDPAAGVLGVEER